VKSEDTTAVIGAGPYGLSVAAYLQARGVPTQVFGKPMEFWDKMPPRMYLKSSWSALDIYDPSGEHSLNRFSESIGVKEQQPVPLQHFLKYGHWFQKQVVPDVDETYVEHLRQEGSGFHLDLADGRSVEARKVVLAVGVAAFAHIPEFARDLPSTLASHSQDHADFSPFKGKKVVVVGNGQSALESAALLHEAGASVELLARGPVRWIDRRLYATGVLKRVFYPPSDVGPPGVNWLVASPLLFSHFPAPLRVRLDDRAVRPSGASWLRPRVNGCVPLTENTSVLSTRVQGEQVQLNLSDGTKRTVDHIVLGTGYQADVDALTFIDVALRQRIQTRHGYPLLNEWFESSVPHLHFTGGSAWYNFGPLCRFVVGAKVPARQIAKHAVQTL
jgi:hypothetical protein